MRINTLSYTTVTRHIELSPNEEFAYKRSALSPTRMVSSLSIQHDHFTMLYRDKKGTLRMISRDHIPQNVHFSIDEVPDMPKQLQRLVEESQAELRQEHNFTNSSANTLFAL